MCIDYNAEIEASDDENEFVSYQMEALLRGEYNPESPSMIEEALHSASDLFYLTLSNALKSGLKINELVNNQVVLYCELKANETAEEMYRNFLNEKKKSFEDFLISQAERN